MFRKARSTRGVRFRLTVAFVLVAAISAGVLAVSSYLLVRQERMNESLTRARSEARFDLGLASGISSSQSRQSLSGFVRQYNQRRVHVVLALPGRPAIASDPRVNPRIPERLRHLVDDGQLGYQRMLVGGMPFLVVGGDVAGSAAQMYLFFSENQINIDLGQLRQVLLIGSGIIVVLALAVARVLAVRTLEPVARASAAARSMADGDLSTRLPTTATDEFGAWAFSFNRMANALEAKIIALSAAQARERRFTSDVAHELRTPLTALVAEASLLREHVGGMADDVRRPAQLLIGDVTRLKTLVEELMELSRLDAGQEPVHRTEVDVRAVVDSMLSVRGWQASVRVDGDRLVISMDPRRLERILFNLVDNALHHGGGSAHVLITQVDDNAVITVTDPGPGIPAEHVPHIFDRFYKADSARTGSGSGLGLAIALENAHLLGGDLTVRSDNSSETQFELTLPIPFA
jgi:signal transduction histidine kinase